MFIDLKLSKSQTAILDVLKVNKRATFGELCTAVWPEGNAPSNFKNTLKVQKFRINERLQRYSTDMKIRSIPCIGYELVDLTAEVSNGQ